MPQSVLGHIRPLYLVNWDEYITNLFDHLFTLEVHKYSTAIGQTFLIQMDHYFSGDK